MLLNFSINYLDMFTVVAMLLLKATTYEMLHFTLDIKCFLQERSKLPELISKILAPLLLWIYGVPCKREISDMDSSPAML